jgi:hypothetical protein
MPLSTDCSVLQSEGLHSPPEQCATNQSRDREGASSPSVQLRGRSVESHCSSRTFHHLFGRPQRGRMDSLVVAALQCDAISRDGGRGSRSYERRSRSLTVAALQCDAISRDGGGGSRSCERRSRSLTVAALQCDAISRDGGRGSRSCEGRSRCAAVAALTLGRLALLCVALALPLPLWGQTASNMTGRQSQNEGLVAVPATRNIVIDGKLDDWDWSGRIWVFADSSIRNRYSVEFAAMYDSNYLYLAAKWKDPTPMFSTVDPDFNPQDGWKSDAIQFRLQSDKNSWITTWYYAPKQMAVVHISDWKNAARDKDGQDIRVLRTASGSNDLGEGAQAMYRADADGKGYVQEMRLPWKLIYKQPPQIQAGMKFRMGLEFLWGDPTGKTWPVHRYADNMQPGVTSREFFWTATNAWGNVELVPKGDVPVRQYVDESSIVQGTVPIRATIPAKAARLTMVIDDAQGRRVRNLAADALPEEYTVSQAGGKRTVEVKWDGLNDKGQIVAPGTYHVRGLTQDGVGAEYEMAFYNPGTPPWQTSKGNGAWGADHTAPVGVARAGDWTIVSWPLAEGGAGIIGIGPDGLKKWGEKRGSRVLAADENFVYAVSGPDWNKQGAFARFGKKDGSYKPFVLDGKALPFELPLTSVFGTETVPGAVIAMAAQGGRLVLGFDGARIAVLDAASAKLLKVIVAPALSGLAFSRDGKLYGLMAGRLERVDLDSGGITPVPTPGLVKPSALDVDLDGNIVVADTGPDSQVKAYSPAGVLVYTAGRKGGRPIRGDFDAQAMLRMSSVAVDAKGLIWVVESWNYPRRVSVWNRDGSLARDYVGNTGYAGTGVFLHDQDPTLAYVGPIELKLDRAARTWKVNKVLWEPDPAKGEGFAIDTGIHTLPQRFTAMVNGQAHEYLYTHEIRDGTGHTIYMEKNGAWRPVASVSLVNHISGLVDRSGIVKEMPTGEFADLDPADIVFWHDANGDGIVQRSECSILPARSKSTLNGRRGNPAITLTNGWGGRIGQDFVFYTDGITQFRPARFTADGIPVYTPGTVSKLALEDQGDLVPVPEEKLLLNLSFKGYAGPTSGMQGIDPATGAVLWSYPNLYPGVHGSHDATMPKPGLMIGPLKICGVAKVNEKVGRVVLLRGNLGQNFIFTTDGLFVGSMFQDTRLPTESLPDTEALLLGRPMDMYTEGGEPFNGWFGKQGDGVIRETSGIAGQAGMSIRVDGLDTIQRFDGPTLNMTPEILARALKENAAREVSKAAAKTYSIHRLTKAPDLNGDGSEFRDLPAMEIQKLPNKGLAKLGYDDRNLYVDFEVQDPSPMRNEGKDYTRLFKTGDAVDLQLCTETGVAAKRANLLPCDMRIVFSQYNGKAVAVLMKPLDAGAAVEKRVSFHSPVGEKLFQRLEILADARVVIQIKGGAYRVQAAIPLATLGLQPKAGMVIRGDAGIIFSDAQGLINVARAYWSNSATNLVNDLPEESWLVPASWGEWTFQ